MLEALEQVNQMIVPRGRQGPSPTSEQNEPDPVYRASESRSIAESLVSDEIKAESKESQAVNYFSSLGNKVKTYISWALKGAAIAGGSLTVLMYMLGVPMILSFLAVIPTAMAVYIAFNLDHSVNKNAADLSKDPIKVVEKAVDDYKKLETDSRAVLAAIDELNNLSKNDSRLERAEELKDRLRVIVDAWLEQLGSVDKSNPENQGLHSLLSRYQETLGEASEGSVLSSEHEQ